MQPYAASSLQRKIAAILRNRIPSHCITGPTRKSVYRLQINFLFTYSRFYTLCQLEGRMRFVAASHLVLFSGKRYILHSTIC